MSARTTTGRVRLAALVTLVGALAVGCSTSSAYTPTALPTPTAVATSTPSPSASTAAPACPNALASYEPTGSLPPAGEMPSGSAMAEIQKRGRLVVGVSADTLLLGARNPVSGQIEGFDITMARTVADAIFGDPSKVELKVITAADRIPVLTEGSVDLVARNMTITCARWQQIAFSAEYYRAGQKVLVPLGSTVKSMADLDDKRVCAPAGTSSLENIAKFPQVKPVSAATHTSCLVKFQQGQVDAITGDDTVLAGLAAQDPYAQVVGDAFTAEPYGLGISLKRPDLVRFVNAVLARDKADGTWKSAYDTWLGEALGPAPKPPVAVYGRTP